MYNVGEREGAVVSNWYQLFFNHFSANKMQQIKQVEVRMDESHLEARAEASEGTCSIVCDKIMKHMVLTLTILGKCSCHRHGAFTYNPPVIYTLILASAAGGGVLSPSMRLQKEAGHIAPWSRYRRADKRIHTCARLTLTACFFGKWKMEATGTMGWKASFPVRKTSQMLLKSDW